LLIILCYQVVYYEQLQSVINRAFNGPSQSVVEVAESADNGMQNDSSDSDSCIVTEERNGKTFHNGAIVSIFGATYTPCLEKMEPLCNQL